jgi:hypothetical protein
LVRFFLGSFLAGTKSPALVVSMASTAASLLDWFFLSRSSSRPDSPPCRKRTRGALGSPRDAANSEMGSWRTSNTALSGCRCTERKYDLNAFCALVLSSGSLASADLNLL